MKPRALFPAVLLLAACSMSLYLGEPVSPSQHPASGRSRGEPLAELKLTTHHSPLTTHPAIQVPSGFVVELVAAPPLVKYPMMACCDERGRLFIAESDGQNLGKAELLKQQPRFVRMLDPARTDGKFHKGRIFADKMVMPEGALWHDGALFIVSAPYLWRLEDSDGDGTADKRDKLVGEMDLIGNANQHGPYLAPNGRLFFSGGTFGYNLVGKDGKGPGKGNWAGVFSCRPDGTDVRVECHAGINPVEVAFTPEGEALGTCAIFDMVGGRHDALVHWVHGASYGERLREPTLKQTGRYLPALTRWGQVAPSGLLRYRGTQFGEAFRDNLFVCQFNSHKVVRVRLKRVGATFRAESEDFLVSLSADFHPADILEDADGSLLLLDTGGWLTMGCPTSKNRPEVFGGIYRIRKVDGPAAPDPRGLKMNWATARAADLVPWLDDPRPAVRDRALATLALSRASLRSNEAVSALGEAVQTGKSVRLRRNAVWALSRIGTSPPRQALCQALADRDASVLQAAVHALGILREPGAVQRLRQLVVQGEAPVRREAATALGLIGRAEAVPALLESLRSAGDEFLEHALTYALIEINAPAPTSVGLSDSMARVRRAALVALDQMRDGRLTRELVAPLLDSADPDVQRAALEVVGKRRWAADIVGLLGKWLADPRPDAARQAMIGGAVLAFAKDAEIQARVADTLNRNATPRVIAILLVETIGRTGLQTLPPSWVEALSRFLQDPDVRLRREAVAAIAALDTDQLDAALLALTRDSSTGRELRVLALAVVARHGARLDDDALKLLISQIHPDTGPVERLSAAGALGKAKLSQRQVSQLPALVSRAGPLELAGLLGAFETAAQDKQLSKTQSAKLGFELAEALAKSPGLTSLSAGRVQALLDRYPPEVRLSGKGLLAKLRGDTEQQRARLAELEPQLAKGSAQRGKQIFFSNRAACSACHRIGTEGGDVGPNLSKIGQIRSSRDLLESILFPSATIANGYETYTVTTRSGRTISGLLRRQTAEAIHLVPTDRSEIRVARADIEELSPNGESVMPQGLEKIMSADELVDVVAYLRTLR